MISSLETVQRPEPTARPAFVNQSFKVESHAVGLACAPAILPRNAAELCVYAGVAAMRGGGGVFLSSTIMHVHCIIYKLWTGSFSNRGRPSLHAIWCFNEHSYNEPLVEFLDILTITIFPVC